MPQKGGPSFFPSDRSAASSPPSTFGAKAKFPETSTGVSSSAMTWLKAMSV